MLYNQLKIQLGIFENGTQLQECICECINSLYLNPSKDGLQNFLERTPTFGAKPVTKMSKMGMGQRDGRQDKRSYRTQMNFWENAETYYSGWDNVPDHYNNIKDLPRFPLKIWKKSGNSHSATLNTSFLSLKCFATRLTNAINSCDIYDLNQVQCSTFEEKWNMIMAAFGGFYIEAVGLKDLIFSKASKVINRKSSSVAWNTLGVRGGNLPEKVKIQYSALLGVPHMLKRCTSLFGSFRNANPKFIKGLRIRANRARNAFKKNVSSHLQRTVIERLFTEEGFWSNDNMLELLVNSLMFTKPKRRANWHLPLAYRVALSNYFPSGPEHILNSLREAQMATVHDPWIPGMVALEMHQELGSSFVRVFGQDITLVSDWKRVPTTRKHDGSQAQLTAAWITAMDIPGPLKDSPSFAVGGIGGPNSKFQFQ